MQRNHAAEESTIENNSLPVKNDQPVDLTSEEFLNEMPEAIKKVIVRNERIIRYFIQKLGATTTDLKQANPITLRIMCSHRQYIERFIKEMHVSFSLLASIKSEEIKDILKERNSIKELVKKAKIPFSELVQTSAGVRKLLCQNLREIRHLIELNITCSKLLLLGEEDLALVIYGRVFGRAYGEDSKYQKLLQQLQQSSSKALTEIQRFDLEDFTSIEKNSLPVKNDQRVDVISEEFLNEMPEAIKKVIVKYERNIRYFIEEIEVTTTDLKQVNPITLRIMCSHSYCVKEFIKEMHVSFSLLASIKSEEIKDILKERNSIKELVKKAKIPFSELVQTSAGVRKLLCQNIREIRHLIELNITCSKLLLLSEENLALVIQGGASGRFSKYKKLLQQLQQSSSKATTEIQRFDLENFVSPNNRVFEISEERKNIVNEEDKLSLTDMPGEMVEHIGFFIQDNEDKAAFAIASKTIYNFFQPNLNQQAARQLQQTIKGNKQLKEQIDYLINHAKIKIQDLCRLDEERVTVLCEKKHSVVEIFDQINITFYDLLHFDLNRLKMMLDYCNSVISLNNESHLSFEELFRLDLNELSSNDLIGLELILKNPESIISLINKTGISFNDILRLTYKITSIRNVLVHFKFPAIINLINNAHVTFNDLLDLDSDKFAIVLNFSDSVVKFVNDYFIPFDKLMNIQARALEILCKCKLVFNFVRHTNFSATRLLSLSSEQLIMELKTCFDLDKALLCWDSEMKNKISTIQSILEKLSNNDNYVLLEFAAKQIAVWALKETTTDLNDISLQVIIKEINIIRLLKAVITMDIWSSDNGTVYKEILLSAIQEIQLKLDAKRKERQSGIKWWNSGLDSEDENISSFDSGDESDDELDEESMNLPKEKEEGQTELKTSNLPSLSSSKHSFLFNKSTVTVQNENKVEFRFENWDDAERLVNKYGLNSDEAIDSILDENDKLEFRVILSSNEYENLKNEENLSLRK